MGYPMGKRLCEAGLEVHVWNRTRCKAERLQAFGATVHDTPALAVVQADMVITLLNHGAVMGDTLFAQGAAAALRPGSLFIDMSSIKSFEARLHAARLVALDVNYLDAPVSGGTLGAEQGTLAIMAEGNAEDFARHPACLPVSGPRHACRPHWRRATGQASQPDDCGHHY